MIGITLQNLRKTFRWNKGCQGSTKTSVFTLNHELKKNGLTSYIAMREQLASETNLNNN